MRYLHHLKQLFRIFLLRFPVVSLKFGKEKTQWLMILHTSVWPLKETFLSHTRKSLFLSNVQIGFTKINVEFVFDAQGVKEINGIFSNVSNFV